MDNISYSPKLVPKVVELQLLAHTPFMLFDIGCGQGIDPAWRFFGKDLHAHGFDPQEEECARLAGNETNRNVHYHAAYVGLPAGHPFHTKRAARPAERDRSYESFFARSSTYRANLRTKRDPAKASSPEISEHERKQLSPSKIAIGEFVASNQIKDIDFVKIDTDGGDLAAAISYNIDKLMRKTGFTVFSLAAYKYSRAALLRSVCLQVPIPNSLKAASLGEYDIFTRRCANRLPQGMGW